MTDILKSVSFSGHRKITESVEEVGGRLRAAVLRCIKNGKTNFIAGGALGFDILAERIILDLKEYYPNIMLTLALPCPPEEQIAHWREQQKDVYSELLSKADEVKILSPHYTSGCMYKRNRYMVDNSSELICYLRQESGGTFYTVNYAKTHDKIITKI